jgi:rubrerythrin
MTATPTQTTGFTVDSPVDDPTYNVLMALASKLEAIDTYRKYADDGGNAALWLQLAEDDRRHADRLLEELKSHLTTSR